jgi:hypothetical protein
VLDHPCDPGRRMPDGLPIAYLPYRVRIEFTSSP